jgi:2-amino-4-hydroxy-6-hydroxymethyldihydropteridine diphosphokinase
MSEPELQIKLAKQAMQAIPEIKISRESSLIQNPAYGKLEQADFYNQVIEIESSFTPRLLLSHLLEIEAQLGRIRTEKWGPRLIDIDILLAEDMIIDTRGLPDLDGLPELVVPHPDFHNRAFALQLLAELIPNKQHPVMQKSISELYCLLTNTGGKS